MCLDISLILITSKIKIYIIIIHYKSDSFKILHKERRAIDSKEYLLSYIGLVFLFLLAADYLSLNFVGAVKSSKVTCYVARYPAQTLTVYRDVHIS